jgi:phospho-N-acetylmuramoyl-pentapeptide-transferase
MIPILLAATVAMLVSLVGTPLVIAFFRGRGFGQPIREEGPTSHRTKAGTPTMGGTAIVLATVLAYSVAQVGRATWTVTGVLLLATFVAMSLVGLADDLIKLRRRRSLGLNKTTKFGGQALIAFLFAWLGPEIAGISRSISVMGSIEFPVSQGIFTLWIFLLIVGTSNAVNLTDGLDGLAAGSAALVFGAYTLIAFWQFRNAAEYPIGALAALDVAVVTAAVTAAAAGFLWHNAPPARIFMGDTGSLALGGLLAAVAVVTNTQVLLVVLGGLFVLETLSVVVQVAVFRTTGRRVFRMAPFHHHFELLGWQEATIIVRFWILAGIGVALGLGLFYAEYLTRVELL